MSWPKLSRRRRIIWISGLRRRLRSDHIIPPLSSPTHQTNGLGAGRKEGSTVDVPSTFCGVLSLYSSARFYFLFIRENEKYNNYLFITLPRTGCVHWLLYRGSFSFFRVGGALPAWIYDWIWDGSVTVTIRITSVTKKCGVLLN